MQKIKLISITGLLLVFVIFIFSASSLGYKIQIQAQSSTLLDEAILYETGLETARAFGLLNEPTAIYTQSLRASEWSVTMFNLQVIENPDFQVYLMAVKGEITTGGLRGLDLQNNLDESANLEGLTVVLDAATGQPFAILGRYVNDPFAETTVEDLQMYETLRNSDLRQFLDENAPPTPGPLPYPVMPETTVEVIP